MNKTFELRLHRSYKGAQYTIGHLYLPGQDRYFCDTMEDIDRGLTSDMTLSEIARIKVHNETAIPTGRYRVLMDVISPKYAKKANWVSFNKAMMPRLRRAEDPTQEVPGYTGVLIHTGNDQDDSAGCLLVGQNKMKGRLLNSTVVFKDLYAILLRQHKAGNEIYITIE